MCVAFLIKKPRAAPAAGRAGAAAGVRRRVGGLGLGPVEQRVHELPVADLAEAERSWA